ncbi:phospholipid scramblase 1-like isoform X2 [Ornithodoros turicata]|uniref:phospholipid scramblase 1-like isoform X2 n=1 Tax=Ornithodoros turicata TaxID=34597 RepID=UPI00313A2AC7
MTGGHNGHSPKSPSTPGSPRRSRSRQPSVSGNVAKGPRQPIEGCAPGLEYLAVIDQLIVQQKVEFVELIPVLPYETVNKYTAKNSMGQFVYSLLEESECLARQCCGSSRCFQMHVFDISNREVMRFIRPLRCTSCIWFCCLQKVEVQAPPGVTIGFVNQNWSVIYPWFNVCDQSGKPLLHILGPCCTMSCPCCCEVRFKITTMTGEEVGQICKQWAGLAKEAFTNADNYGISFPMDMDVHVKACLLGCAMLIDYMFFEVGKAIR